MIQIPTDALGAAAMQVARDLAASQIIQSAIGTVLGMAVIAVAPTVLAQMMRPPVAAWSYFRTPAAPLIDATAAAAAAA
jgi:ascorbate-specific PTS system EIIC-type component UlaA